MEHIGKGGDASEQTLLREAQQHLERARALDPEGVVAPAFIRRVRQQPAKLDFQLIPRVDHLQLATLTPEYNTASNESDDDMIEVDSKGLGRKRIRI
jgi:hypothetical protein